MPFGATMPDPDIGQPETFIVEDRTVACDGGGGALGHPRVWLRIVHDQTFCPWCSRIFRLDPAAAHSGGGH